MPLWTHASVKTSGSRTKVHLIWNSFLCGLGKGFDGAGLLRALAETHLWDVLAAVQPSWRRPATLPLCLLVGWATVQPSLGPFLLQLTLQLPPPARHTGPHGVLTALITTHKKKGGFNCFGGSGWKLEDGQISSEYKSNLPEAYCNRETHWKTVNQRWVEWLTSISTQIEITNSTVFIVHIKNYSWKKKSLSSVFITTEFNVNLKLTIDVVQKSESSQRKQEEPKGVKSFWDR